MSKLRRVHRIAERTTGISIFSVSPCLRGEKLLYGEKNTYNPYFGLLCIHVPVSRLIIPVAGIREFRQYRFQRLQVCLRQPDICRRGIFPQVFYFFGAGNRNNMLSLRQHPGQGQLGCCSARVFC